MKAEALSNIKDEGDHAHVGDEQGRADIDGRAMSDAGDKSPFTTIDNLPVNSAICKAELDAIERYMNDILDEVLGGRDSCPLASSHHKLLP